MYLSFLFYQYWCWKLADKVSLDWLSYTITGMKDVAGMDVAKLLVTQMWGDYDEANQGFRGYSDSGYLCQTGRIAWDSRRS